MKKTWLAASLIALSGIGIQGSALGHGGTYRGPGDTVPPGGGGAGGGGGGPAGPGSPGSPGSPGNGNPGAGPITGAPGVSGPGQTGGRNGAITGDRLIGGPDLTGWSFWWEFNKDYYLNLKEALFTDVALTGDAKFFTGEGRRENAKESLRPSPTLIRQEVVPALLSALETETNNDIITGCMIALAKIGDHQLEDGSSPLAAVFRGFLSDGNQEIRETAALALGILANDGSVAVLTDLMTDSEAGRKVVGRSEVDYRQRAFAAYGLALVGNRTASEDIRRRIVRTLAEAIDSDQTATRDLKVACIIGMGLVPLDTLGSPRGEDEQPLPAEASRTAQVDYLLRFFKDKNGQPVEQAHCPTALTRLAQKLPADRAEELKQLLAREFMECIGKRTAKQFDDAIQQSAVLALGQLGDCDEDAIDVEIRRALVDAPNFTVDQQVRYFAQVALGEIGGRGGTGDSADGRREVSSTLARTLSNGNAGARWAGLGIGVMGHALAQTGEGRMPEELVLALRSELTKAKSPEDLGAFSVAIGMVGDQHSSEVLLDKLDRLNDEVPRGYVALSLGLLNDRQAIEPIQQVVRDSKYRPELLKQAAIALGLLGDKDLVPEMIDMLRESKSLASQASICSALGFIGDRRSIAPLVEMLHNKALTDSARGFAAVALGTVADKELFPWNHKIASGLNYRASTVTLNSAEDGTGVLNIL